MFSEKQIIEELKSKNDDKAYTLLLDLNGDFRAISTENCGGYKYIGSIASTDPDDGYVGKEAAEDSWWVNKCLENSKTVWERYKNDGKTYELAGSEPFTTII